MCLHLFTAVKIPKEQSVFGITDVSGPNLNQKNLLLFSLKQVLALPHPATPNGFSWHLLPAAEQSDHNFFSKYSRWERCPLDIAVGIIVFYKYTIKSPEKSFTLFLAALRSSLIPQFIYVYIDHGAITGAESLNFHHIVLMYVLTHLFSWNFLCHHQQALYYYSETHFRWPLILPS